jgi:hypothetical protein
MRAYQLADVSLRESVNLTVYEDVIKEIIHQVIPSAEVIVQPDRYLIKNEISKGDAIRIGRNIAHSELGRFCLQRAILFIGHDIPKALESKGGHM